MNMENETGRCIESESGSESDLLLWFRVGTYKWDPVFESQEIIT